MKSWYLWVGLALLALFLLSVREGFAATATIKNPDTWDDAEYARIKAMVSPASTVSDAQLERVVGGFWGAWEAATSRITLADVNTYLDGVTGLGSKRNEYRDMIQAYYINQGQSVFTSASGYSAGDMDTASSSSSSSSSSSDSTTTTIERPTTSTSKLRQDIAATMGVPTTNTSAIDAVITQVQKFYDTVYLPDKKAPTYTAITGFADGVDVSTVPAAIQNNFKVHLISILQTYFAGSGSSSVSAMDTSATGGGADITSSAGGAGEGAEGGQTLGTGKNVQGPASGGQGTANTTGGLGLPRTYPLLYGGLQDYKSALPTSASLGTDPTSKYLPYSRVPGDQDLYPDPYRLGKYFSSSSYSEKESPEPAPVLTDFSKFLS